MRIRRLGGGCADVLFPLVMLCGTLSVSTSIQYTQRLCLYIYMSLTMVRSCAYPSRLLTLRAFAVVQPAHVDAVDALHVAPGREKIVAIELQTPFSPQEWLWRRLASG